MFGAIIAAVVVNDVVDVATASVATVVVIVVIIVAVAGVVIIVIVGREREVSFGFGATELTCGFVVGTCGFLGGIESAQPNAAFLAWVPYFRGVSSPWSLPYASKMRLLDAAAAVCGGFHGGRFLPRRHVNWEQQL